MTFAPNVKTSAGAHRSHTGRGGRGERLTVEFAESPCQGAMEVIFGVSVATGKLRASTTEQGGNFSHRDTPLQQRFGDPLIGDAPVSLGESLGNAEPLQPSLIDGTGSRAVAGRDWQIGNLRA